MTRLAQQRPEDDGGKRETSEDCRRAEHSQNGLPVPPLAQRLVVLEPPLWTIRS